MQMRAHHSSGIDARSTSSKAQSSHSAAPGKSQRFDVPYVSPPLVVNINETTDRQLMTL